MKEGRALRTQLKIYEFINPIFLKDPNKPGSYETNWVASNDLNMALKWGENRRLLFHGEAMEGINISGMTNKELIEQIGVDAVMRIHNPEHAEAVLH